MRAALGAFAVALAAFVSFGSAAQVLYKWTDKDGRVQYGDQPPKKFDGPVTRIEIDTKANTRPMKVAPRAPEETAEETPAEAADPARKRRMARLALESRLVEARARYEGAKKALEDAAAPDVEERQVVQQRFDKMQAGRSNCRAAGKDANGKNIFNCPALVPNDAYYERIKRLEDAVKAAEDELAAAEQAYRRGTD